jgi:hypothetical protein
MTSHADITTLLIGRVIAQRIYHNARRPTSQVEHDVNGIRTLQSYN